MSEISELIRFLSTNYYNFSFNEPVRLKTLFNTIEAALVSRYPFLIRRKQLYPYIDYFSNNVSNFIQQFTYL